MTEQFFNFRDLTIATLQSYPDIISSEVNAAYDAIVLQNKLSYNCIVRPIIDVYTRIRPICNSLQYVKNFYTDRQMRDAASDIVAHINKFLIECEYRKDVYTAFEYYRTQKYESEKPTLTPEEILYFEHTMRDFRRSGLHLSDDEIAEIKEMKKQLSDLEISFEQNIAEDNTAFYFTREELDGMPDYWLNDEEKIVNGLYKMTLKYPDIHPALEYIRNSDVRKKLFLAYSSVAHPKNTEILEKAIMIRQALAKKLGYKSYADMIAEINIIKTSAAALKLSEEISVQIKLSYLRDINKIFTLACSNKENPIGKDKLDMWDLAFYKRLYQETYCDFNKDDLRKYFPFKKVKEGTFAIYQKLLGVKFEGLPTDNKWHPDVELYRTTDSASGELLGYFYLDMYPRDGKFTHAAVFEFITGYQSGAIRHPHIVTMACNFPKGECLPFDDVETFFHEFGHVMHHICSKPQLSFHGGLATPCDFVEAPSQFLEYFCYCEQSLSLMTQHEDTGEKIPMILIEKLRACKKATAATLYTRQIMFGLYDLQLHTANFAEKPDSTKLWHDLEKVLYDENTIALCDSDSYAPQASFGHLFGYDARYYSYLLTDIFASSMFYKVFGPENVLNPDLGMLYRKKILEPGATRDGMDLLRDFLGEEPNTKYFLMDRGFI